MSVMTSTNEENLITYLKDMPDDHTLILRPSSTLLLDVFIVPRKLEESFERMSPELRRTYWKGGFGGINFHSEVWKAKGNMTWPSLGAARRYR